MKRVIAGWLAVATLATVVAVIWFAFRSPKARVVHTFGGHTSTVERMAFAPGNRLLASSSQDETVRLWDTHTGAEEAGLRGHDGVVYSMAFNPAGTTLASADTKSIKLWDTTTWKLQAAFDPGAISLLRSNLGFYSQ